MSNNVLIIKLGAMGDILRTTPILRGLKGEITWVVKKESIPILEGIPFLDEIVDINNASKLTMEHFDLVINLEDNYQAAELVNRTKKRELIGAYFKNKKIIYTDSSSAWFDMGLISKFGIDKANQLKKENRHSYQEIIFAMIGKSFNAEEYILGFINFAGQSKQTDIGIEYRAGAKWPMKRWNKYGELAEQLQKDGYTIKIFRQWDSVQEYIQDINQCSIIVTGDTLAMHIGLALKKKIIAIFTCTSPNEIFDYGRMKKVVNPLLDEYFYKRELGRGVVNAISVKAVYRAIKEIERLKNHCTI